MHDCLREMYSLGLFPTFGAFLKLPSTKIQFHFLVSRSMSDEYFHLYSNPTTKSDRLLARFSYRILLVRVGSIATASSSSRFPTEEKRACAKPPGKGTSGNRD